MRQRLAIVYNEPCPSRYDTAGEEKAVISVLNAVDAVHQALLEIGDVLLLPLASPWPQAEKKLQSLDADLVFNLFEGFCGEPETEAMVPQTLAGLGIPYTGCPAPVIRLALDKVKAKVVLKAAGIPTPDFQLLNPDTLSMFRLGYPCLVKPRGEDASHGITARSVVDNFSSLSERVTAISNAYPGGALVEEFIDGREFNATVMGNSRFTVLPVSEIVYSLPPEMPRILTFAAKWEPDSPYYQGTQAVCPALINPQEQEYISQTALSAFRQLGCRGYARADMRMDREGRLNVIEVNPNPDISPDTGAARQATAAGMTYARFIHELICLALEKENYDHQDTADAIKRQARPDTNTAEYTRVQTL